MPLVYDELRVLAGHCLRDERVDHTLQPAALLNETDLRMVGQNRVNWNGKTRFMAVAAIQMRCTLVDHARLAMAQKRGGRMNRVELRDRLARMPELSTELLALDEVLHRLAARHPRQATVAELRLLPSG